MDQNQQTPAPETPAQNPFPAINERKETSTTAIWGAVIVLVIVLLGAWFFMQDEPTMETMPPVTTETQNGDSAATGDPTTEALAQQGTSDEITDIEADLNATDLGAMEADLEAAQ